MFIMSTIINHLRMYTTSINLNYMYNVGFILGILMVIQTISGLMITLTYYSSMVLFSNIYFMSMDYYYGYLIRSLHVVGVAFINLFILIHIFKGIIYSNIVNHTSVFYSGLVIYLLIVVISYIGYILTFGMISFWGATVITNLLSVDLASAILGSFQITEITINRYLVYHVLLTLILYVVIVIHIFYLHSVSSLHILMFKNTLIGNLTFNYYLYKDATSIIVIITLMMVFSFFIIINLSNSNNLVEIEITKTPTHIIPEWYFLYLYSVLKLIPSKMGGLLIIVLYIFLFLFILSSYTSWTTMIYNSTINAYSTIGITLSLAYSYIILTYIGLQLPLYVYLQYARIVLLIHFILCVSSLYTNNKLQ